MIINKLYHDSNMEHRQILDRAIRYHQRNRAELCNNMWLCINILTYLHMSIFIFQIQKPSSGQTNLLRSRFTLDLILNKVAKQVIIVIIYDGHSNVNPINNESLW